MNAEERSLLAERLMRKYGAGASSFAEEYAAVHGRAGRIPAQEAWLDLAARIRADLAGRAKSENRQEIGREGGGACAAP